MKIRPVGDELFHAEEKTDSHDEADSQLIVGFYNFAIASKNNRGTKQYGS
jgi:hypothetical protein